MSAKKELPHINVDYFAELTGEIPSADSDDTREIGERIQQLRKEKGFSLEQLAGITDYSPEFLEKIENDEIMPQLGTAMKLSKALDAAVGGLVSGEGDRPYAITRVKDQQRVSRSTSQKGAQHLYLYKSLAAAVQGRHMEPLLVQLAASEKKEVSQHDGEEFVYVLQGKVVLEIGGKTHELNPGDSAYYASASPHWITAREEKATILAVLFNQ
ncbi:MAG: XRE family transcriptional regulator [Deltaproteobacteria bacterium]|nr:MAG: XRE family transcriptional regulator [Deltaproteobacteria bacterium]